MAKNSLSSPVSVRSLAPLTRPGLRLSRHEKIVSIRHNRTLATANRQRAVSPLLALVTLTHGFTQPIRAATVTRKNRHITGLNLYDAFFPRDAHIVATFLRDTHPELTKATVLESLHYTGIKDNLRGPGLKDEQEVGKVPHEVRDPERDPIARQLTAKKDWGWPYYGAIDTTGKNINAIAYLVEHDGVDFLKTTYLGQDGGMHTVEEGLRSHVNWLRRRMDFNPEGLIEMLWINPKHHANQTWSDSPDAFHHADGSWPSHYPSKNLGVASLEHQAETYDALVNAAEIYERLLKRTRGRKRAYLKDEIADLLARAEKLKRVIMSEFWVEDSSRHGGFFARGTDRDSNGRLRPFAIRSSDMGHVLNSRILDGDDPEIVKKREAVVRNLFSPEMLCASGIRTLSSDSRRYYKDRYHNGASWPWVTYFISLGLERHGYYGLARELKKRIIQLYRDTKLLPEFVSGSDDSTERMITDTIMVHDPTAPERLYAICQPAQEIQAWTAAAVLAIKNDDKRHHTSSSLRSQLEREILPTLL